MSSALLHNKSRLRDLLTIGNPRTERIFDVIDRMEVLLDCFEKTPKYHALVPFLMTYHLVTKTVAEKFVTHRHFFSNIRDLEHLDVVFASLYFEPLRLFLEEGRALSPWHEYFRYCQKPDGIAFLQVLLGINAHINTDLYAVLVGLDYTHKNDFFIINDVLREVTPQIMRFLAFHEYDLFGATGVLLKHHMAAEFHQVIEKWRTRAWHNAQATPHAQAKTHILHAAKETEDIARHLITTFPRISNLHHLNRSLGEIHGLGVEISR